MSGQTNAIQTEGLGKKYGSFWALEQCNITVPVGRVSALVGPNGAGKSTLLKLLTGLSTASSGSSLIFNKPPSQTDEFLGEIGYLAQEIPLYKQLTPGDHIAMGAHLNKRWDNKLITTRLSDLGIPLDKPVGKLSGGQRAQVALALALAKKPKLLLLDEPVAALDPLARHDFLSSLAQAVSDGGLTVVMSSHLLADLERVCDHVIVVATGKTQICDDIDTVLNEHRILVGPREHASSLDGINVIHETHTAKQSTLLVRLTKDAKISKHWQQHEPNVEEIILAYMGQAKEGGAR
ncbi:MAG TPA: ABC transporter ATP-binding protein [Patescibacteria group bacterium]|nr:ABC transporter ATP-binding protein [Patescibacteria group bacterium]